MSGTSNSHVRQHKKKKKALAQPGSTSLSDKLSIVGASYTGNYRFAQGNSVPIYEVSTVQALNQLIGHAKFNNHEYGSVFYRGECSLHSSLKPALLRKNINVCKPSERINKLIQKILNDSKLRNEIKVGTHLSNVDKWRAEGLLQHYGVPTRYIDIVDNHWVALWMGLHRSDSLKQTRRYFHYQKRTLPLFEIASGKHIAKEDLFQYILLIAIPHSRRQPVSGVSVSTDFILIDLRQALPSTFLRPHAQHGLVIKRKPRNRKAPCSSDAYDMASAVIGILKLRIDRVQSWLGNGELLSQDNLFPPPAYDHGYDLLLQRDDLFDGSGFEIARYV